MRHVDRACMCSIMKVRIARYTVGVQGNSFATCLYCSRIETSAYLTKERTYKWSRRDLKVEGTSAVCFSREHCLLLSVKPSFFKFFTFFFYSSCNLRATVSCGCISDAPTRLLSKTCGFKILFEFSILSICAFYHPAISH